MLLLELFLPHWTAIRARRYDRKSLIRVLYQQFRISTYGKILNRTLQLLIEDLLGFIGLLVVIKHQSN